MKRWISHTPVLITFIACGLALYHGPIGQLPGYHGFADQSVVFGIAHAADVFSNLGFALVAVWGWIVLVPQRDHPELRAGWPGYRLFLSGLFLTALGSSFYHLAPDNFRLVWDRLPIALACAGLIVGVRGDTQPQLRTEVEAIWLSIYAVCSVAWWYVSELNGAGDLRPYLLLQGLPIVLIPLWQAIHGAPRTQRIGFGAALLLYVAAKAAEINDYQIPGSLGAISGHTLKHVLATGAAALIVLSLTHRANATSPVSLRIKRFRRRLKLGTISVR